MNPIKKIIIFKNKIWTHFAYQINMMSKVTNSTCGSSSSLNNKASKFSASAMLLFYFSHDIIWNITPLFNHLNGSLPNFLKGSFNQP